MPLARDPIVQQLRQRCNALDMQKLLQSILSPLAQNSYTMQGLRQRKSVRISQQTCKSAEQRFPSRGLAAGTEGFSAPRNDYSDVEKRDASRDTAEAVLPLVAEDADTSRT